MALSVDQIEKLKKIDTPWGEIGYIVFKRTYSRRLKETDKNSPTEEYIDTVTRVVNACNRQLKTNFSPEEEYRFAEILLNLKGLVAGRFLWQLGTKTVDKLGLPSLQNCASVVVNEPIRPFTWAMDLLMLGCGVGFNIQREYVYQIPKLRKEKIKITRIDEKDADFILPDTREAWVKLLGKVLKAHFYTGKGFTYSCQLVRSAGEPIKSFGGLASGPGSLADGIDKINTILNNRAGSKLRTIDCLDIMNIIGMIVVSGNVRRSAELAIGDWDDLEYLKAKRWDLGPIPNWRSNSNNSIVPPKNFNDLPSEFWKTYEQGEPYGLINLDLSRKIGRTGEYQYPDPDVVAYNPCQPDFATVFIKDKGVRAFKELNIGDEIWSKEGWTKVVNKWSTGVKSVSSYRTTGGVFIGTSNHRVDTRYGKVEVVDADRIMTISCPKEVAVEFDKQTVMDGLFIGDGYYKSQEGRPYEYPCLIIGKNDKDYFNSEVKDLLMNKFQSNGECETFRVKTTITSEENQLTYNSYIPNRLYLKDSISTLSLLRGLYSANGSVVNQHGKSARVTYKSTSKIIIDQIQQMLSSVGIRSYVTTNKSKKVLFANGEYTCKESYDLNINKDIGVFKDIIGFIQEYKNKKLAESIEGYTVSSGFTYGKKKSVEYLGQFEVFDITVDNESHTYWTGGLSVSNCAEQSLANYETCCLAEIFLSNIDSKEELFEVATYLYRVNKHSLAIPCSIQETEDVVHKNMRMGIGVTGILQASEEQKSWLSDCYEYLREYDKKYSKENDFPESIKITTTKPSGSLSLLKGVTPGAHPSPAGPYYIRRVRMATNSPLVELCKRNGYFTEFVRGFDGKEDKGTTVVEFPCKVPEGTLIGDDLGAINHLNIIKWIQKNWSDNSVSCTIYYKPDELDEIKRWLSENFNDSLKTVSFMLYSGHGFDQAPYETITKKRYLDLVANINPIKSGSVMEDDFDLQDCDNGSCPIK